jgi:hypothetical protein
MIEIARTPPRHATHARWSIDRAENELAEFANALRDGRLCLRSGELAIRDGVSASASPRICFSEYICYPLATPRFNF